MTQYKIILQEKKEVAQNTMAFYFQKPDGFTHKAGQSVDLTLLHPADTDSLGSTRTFSLASAPYENHLQIAMRMRNTAFKRVLNSLPPGTELLLEGPWGTFTLHEDAIAPAVFITGGIGITPVWNMVKQASFEKGSHRLLAFYANKTPETAVFLPELNELTKTNLNFTFIPTMTQDETWTGIKGRITKDLLQQYIRDLTKPKYYLCGPIAMTTDLRDMLLNEGIDEDNIIFEDFPGY